VPTFVHNYRIKGYKVNTSWELQCKIWLCGIEYYVIYNIVWKKTIDLSFFGSSVCMETQHLSVLYFLTSQSISIFLSVFFRGPGHLEGPQISFPHCAELVLEYCITWDLRSACKQYKSVGRAVVILSQSLSLSSFTQTLSVSLPFTLSLLRNPVWLSLTLK